MKKRKLSKPQLTLVIAGFVAGYLWIGLVRFFLYQPETTHYHANFGVVINDKLEDFSDPSYYEEVQTCSTEDKNPRRRVHMHDLVEDTLHVHDDEVTWGHFFANIGWTLSNQALQSQTEIYVNNQPGKLMFILNGQRVLDISNKVIDSEDVLLVYYGEDDVKKATELSDQIAKTAGEYNQKADPSACKGSKVDLSVSERLKHAFLFDF